MNTAASIENKNYCKYVLFLLDVFRNKSYCLHISNADSLSNICYLCSSSNNVGRIMGIHFDSHPQLLYSIKLLTECQMQ
jgi:hypothetical protein